jgi:hypothetical protein
MVQPLNQIMFGFLLLAGCSSTAEAEPEAGPPPSPTSHEAWCEAQAAPACPKTTPGYADSCKLLMSGQRQKVKEACRTKFDAVMQCGVSRVTYACSASGISQGSPQGACAAVGNDCDTCNGASCTLSGLLGP